jgi:ABC-2 type transport system permease protein
MTQFIRYLKVYKRILGIATMLLVEWRASFIIWTIIHVGELAINLTFFQIILSRTSLVGGWGIYEIAILLGYMELLLGLGGQTFYPMMSEFGEQIRTGKLDEKLVKPLDIQFLVSFPWTDVSDIFSIVTGIFMMTYGVSHLAVGNLALAILTFIPQLVISMIILYSMILMLLTISFITTKFDSVGDLYWTIISIGRYPVSLYKGLFHAFLMFVLPIGLVTSVPARTLAGFFEPGYFVYSIFLAVFLFFISRKIFLANIRHYTSASS